ncbi:hypothetical protein LZ31DRAFT_274051 [Colletotrichum somersetense]|nr:hypothetical protein LZ31DRAFT_274051 [Colletotrichum somersetense]
MHILTKASSAGWKRPRPRGQQEKKKERRRKEKNLRDAAGSLPEFFLGLADSQCNAKAAPRLLFCTKKSTGNTDSAFFSSPCTVSMTAASSTSLKAEISPARCTEPRGGALPCSWPARFRPSSTTSLSCTREMRWFISQTRLMEIATC